MSYEQQLFEMGVTFGRMMEKLDRIDKTLDRVNEVKATPKHRVLRIGQCDCKRCKERREAQG